MRIRTVIMWLVAAILLAGVTRLGECTLIQELTLAELTQRSACIVTGMVIEIQYQEAQGQIWTIVRVAPQRVLKGRSTEYLFRVPGGVRRVNGWLLIAHVEGVPSFNLMQRGVFFLSGNSPEVMQPVGWSQGFWRIENRGGQEMVTAASDEVDPQPVMELREFLKRVVSAQKER